MKNLTQSEWNKKYDSVYAYFYRRVSSREFVEELTVSTLEDFFLYDKKIDNQNALLWGIAKNKMREFIRSKSKLEISLDIQEVDTEDAKKSLYSDYFKQKTQNILDCAKRILKKIDLEIIELSVMCDFRAARTADELGISETNSRKRLSRALQKIRKECKEIWS